MACGGCGFKQAGVGSTGSQGGRGGGTGGVAGSGGMGGAAGSGGVGGTGGMGGRGGSVPVIILMDGGPDRTSISNPDANCGAKNKAAAKVAPDILLLLDRSGSMNDNIMNQMCNDGGFGGQGCGAQSKWAQMIPAITQVIGTTDMEVNWGLKFFPDSSAMACNVNTNAAVPIGPGSGAAITAAIMGATSANGGVMGFNGTPTTSAAMGATTYLSTVTSMNKKFILLATDGQPTCAGGSFAMDDSANAVTAVGATFAAGYPVFVVGISTSTGTADTTLSNMANAGGLPRAGTPTYYPVASATELEAAIRTLIGFAATCTFQIGPPPTDDGTTRLDRIDVFGDGTPIPRDMTRTNGYDYTDASMSAIEVFGPLCEQIKTAAIKDVTVTFQCIPL